MITSTLGRMANADKLSVQQLKQAVQDGTVPAYIGIPLIQEKMKQAQQMQGAQAAPAQPPIADQVLQQASGVPALPSNLPAQMAHGGIIHMATGGYDPMSMARAFTRDDEEPEDMDYLNALGADEMPETQEPEEEPQYQEAAPEVGGIADLTPLNTLAYAAPFSTSRQADQITVKKEGEPAQTLRKETARVERPAAARDLERIALAAGEKYKLDPSLIKHVMFKETGNLKDKANAVSPAGAMGVMQLMPATARELGVKDPFDPVQNIEGGIKYLAKMQRKYDDPKIAAIAYNWGPGHTDRWLAQGGDFSKLPKETQGYIRGLAEGGMAGDDTDGVTVDLSGLNRGSDYDAGQLAQVPEGTSSSDFLDKLLPPLEGGKPNPLREVLRTRKYTPDPNTVEAEGITYNVATPKKAAPPTPDEVRASEAAEAEAQHLLKQKPKKVFNRSAETTKQPAKMPEPVPLSPESIGGQRSMATPESTAAVAASLEDRKPAPVAPSAPAAHDDLRDYFNKGLESLADQKKINAYLALLSGGLGIAGGTSPYAMTNIGQGAQAGVQTYMAGNKDIAAQQAALMQGRLGLEKYQSLRDIQKHQMENLKAYRDAEEARKTESAKMRDITQNTAIQNRNVQAAQNIAQKMERDAVNGARAEVTQALKSPMNMGKSQEEEQALYARAEALAMARLNQHPLYRKLHHDLLTPGYDPGQLQVSPDITDLVNKYTQPKK
jgi:soluble lytic murein transglycosylase-like protein